MRDMKRAGTSIGREVGLSLVPLLDLMVAVWFLLWLRDYEVG
ncbi:hypothetical protein [Streptomyces triculaminicus]